MKKTTKLIYIKKFVNNVRVETVKSSVNNNSHLNLFKNFSALSKKKKDISFLTKMTPFLSDAFPAKEARVSLWVPRQLVDK